MGAMMAAVALLVALPARAEEVPPNPKPDLFPAYRFGYVAGGALAIAGGVFGLLAQSEANRAGTLTSARESTAALALAREHAATANLCYALAGATALYALVMELLPRPAADAVALSFRF